MKRKGWKISIFMLLVSLCAFGLVSWNNKIENVSAAESTEVECYYLINNETPYASNTVVGKVSGGGEFEVGEDGVELQASANDNYQIVGWLICYDEEDRSGLTQYEALDAIVDNKQSITLTTKDGSSVLAEMEVRYVNGYVKNSTFTLSNVFEDLTIKPVFDHIYYNVDATELMQVSSFENGINIESGVTLYAETLTMDAEGVTTYNNAFLEINARLYFYGDLKSKTVGGDVFYYTEHQTLEETSQTENIDYSRGAFRVGDNIAISNSVNIEEDDIKASKNVDLQGVAIVADSTTNLSLYNAENVTDSYFTKEQDNLLRTKSYGACFEVANNTNYINTIDLSYHRLYVVDLKINVDGIAASEEETTEIVGNFVAGTNGVNELIGNISLVNFYSQTDSSYLQYLIKKASDNNTRAFGITCVESISKSVDGNTFTYYNFDRLNGLTNTSQYYSNISNNIEITINYASQTYDICFETLEYVSTGESTFKLNEYNNANTLESISINRFAETVTLDIDDVATISNIGYKFVGFTTSKSITTGNLLSEVSYTIEKYKPKGTNIYLCYEKIEYSIVLNNFNAISIAGAYPLKAINFNIVGESRNINSLLNFDNVSSDTVALSQSLFYGDIITITPQTNSGFNVKFSLQSEDATEFITTLVLNEALISSLGENTAINVYVYEEKETYSITYLIEATEDSDLKKNVIMADISAIAEGKTITESETSAEDGSIASVTILIEGLYYNDVVVLASTALTSEDGAYIYQFNWFTEDGKSTLSYSTDDSLTYSHTETIVKTRTIKVVYSMPNTQVKITIEEEFEALNKDELFLYNYKVIQDGAEVVATNGVYTVAVGKVTISVSDLSFGYTFIGYQLQGTDTVVEVDNLTFEYTAVSGTNDIVLKFGRVEYRFYFTEYGAGKTGTYIKFGEDLSGEDINYTILDIDHTTVEITKPTGYYVSTVQVVNGDFSNQIGVAESNENRGDDDITKYVFALDRDMFIALVQSEDFVVIKGNNREIYIRLDYAIFEYEIKVGFGLTNPKGDSRDDNVKYPSIKLDYTLNKISQTATQAAQNVTFTGIPYGANVTVALLSGAQTGLMMSGWYLDNYKITQEDYTHSSTNLSVGTITQDKEFNYKLSYIAYDIILERNKNQGNPEIYINGNVVLTDSAQVTLYDELKIEANASRNVGYKFKAIKYNVPNYTKFEGDEQAWNGVWSTLYILVNDGYTLNTSSDYNSATEYYIKTVKEVTYTETSTFVDSLFNVENYDLVSNDILFTIEYELLKMSIINTVTEQGAVANSAFWKLTGRGDIKFNIDDFALFEITATDSNGIVRNINDTDYVTYYDVVKILVKINNKALNEIDNNYYDLSLGLTLGLVYVSGKTLGFTTAASDGYVVEFNVGQYMPLVGEDLNIAYTLKIQPKELVVTTIVEDSTSFYQNVKMFINASSYGFEMSAIESIHNASILSHTLQFMAKANSYMTFTTETYQKNFKISGVKIYCNGAEISSADYATYGIEVLPENNWNVVSRMMYNIRIVYKVQPIISYNGGPGFTKSFVCDNSGSPLGQELTKGTTSGYDIQVADFLVPSLIVQYKANTSNSNITGSVKNCGIYDVILTFSGDSYDWLDEIEIAENVTLTIIPKDIFLTYDTSKISQVSKIYDGTSNWSVNNIYNSLVFTDSGSLRISYADILLSSNSNLTIENAKAFISTSGASGETDQANENIHYNLYVYNFNLIGSIFNNNFNLVNTDLVISDYIQITRRKIELGGLDVYNKVYDGTDKAELASSTEIKILNKIVGDDLVLDTKKLSIVFKDKSIGSNKSVVINASNALVGEDVANYYINIVEIDGLTIYPYNVTTFVDGVGEISLINKRGLTQKDKVDLIPLGATLKVKLILADSPQYADIYGTISQFVKGNNEYSIGYILTMTVGGEEVEIDKNLYVSVPNVKNITGAFFLTGSQAGKVDYDVSGNNVVIDLKDLNVDVEGIFITQRRILLKPWQIVLIVLTVVAVITSVVLTLVIVRKRKNKSYSIHEKI